CAQSPWFQRGGSVKSDQYSSKYRSSPLQSDFVIEGHESRATRYPLSCASVTEFPSASTISTAIPNPLPPSVQGFKDWFGIGIRKHPHISVPPEMFIIGTSLWPTFS